MGPYVAEMPPTTRRRLNPQHAKKMRLRTSTSEALVSAIVFVMLILDSGRNAASGFCPHRSSTVRVHGFGSVWSPSRQTSSMTVAPVAPLAALPPLTPVERDVAFWIVAFASSHIGLSAVRTTLIEQIGRVASDVGAVGSGLRLPSWWPGDDVGQDEVFPDENTAGRQLYRFLYTCVSFGTLGMALSTYLSASAGTGEVAAAAVVAAPEAIPPGGEYAFLQSACIAVASASWGTSIASLVNPSPLSLVPGFEQTSSNSDNAVDGAVPVMPVRRDDGLKLEARGLTRVTRHPLILPVVPWGVATSIAVGGRPADWIFFGGLALYAIAGCAAQDLRVSREEGSVGTVFRPGEDADIGDGLRKFFESTSFLPFGAVVDGRQSMRVIVREVPWWALAAGCVMGAVIQRLLLEWLECFY